MTKNSLVLYKSTVAIVLNQDGDKYQIKFCSQPASPGGKKAVYGEQKVREKDVVLLHEGPVSSLENVLSFCDEKIPDQLNETYELLLSDEGTASEAQFHPRRLGIASKSQVKRLQKRVVTTSIIPYYIYAHISDRSQRICRQKPLLPTQQHKGRQGTLVRRRAG